MTEPITHGVPKVSVDLTSQIAAEAVFQSSPPIQSGGEQWLVEVVASFGLVFSIFRGLRTWPNTIPWIGGFYLTAANWLTTSTSFANRAVAIGRAFNDTFSGIRPLDLPGFIVAELVGACVAALFANWLYRTLGSKPQS